jgi:hypothetical protein
MHRRKTPADYHALAEKRGFRWLGLKVPGVRAKTTWECEDGHQWQASFDSVRRGSGCPVCAGNLPKEPADYHAIAEKRGFRWLGPEVPNTQTRTDWKCAQGHQWQGRYGDIQQGKGCPICGGRLRKEPADYHALADKRGFRWLGPEVSYPMYAPKLVGHVTGGMSGKQPTIASRAVEVVLSVGWQRGRTRSEPLLSHTTAWHASAAFDG